MAKLNNVISNSNMSNHVIEGYHFKVMSELQNQEENHHIEEEKSTASVVSNTEQNHVVENPPLQEQIAPQIQPDFVEDLLKKTDEMSGNIIKLQMQMETQEAEFNNRLNTELEHAKEKFTKEGYENAKQDFEKELQELREKYLKSIEKLENSVANLNDFLEKNEKELANTALVIAKEVINKELEENSSLIALNLSKELMSELKNASKIELKLNPNDFDYVKSQMQEQSNIKFSLDDAITKGSVLVLSDVGNIESNLNSRLQKIKNMVNE